MVRLLHQESRSGHETLISIPSASPRRNVLIYCHAEAVVAIDTDYILHFLSLYLQAICFHHNVARCNRLKFSDSVKTERSENNK